MYSPCLNGLGNDRKSNVFMFVELLYPRVMRGENDNKSIENKTRKREGKQNLF